MRAGSNWGDASILNLSPRGMLIRTFSPPTVGSVAEVKRGCQIILGRVVWSADHQFGMRTADTISVNEFADNGSLALAGAYPSPRAVNARSAIGLNAEDEVDRSKRSSRQWQFACAAAFGLAAAGFAAISAHSILSEPLSAVSRSLRAP